MGLEETQMVVSDDEVELTLNKIPDMLIKIQKYLKEQENCEDVINLENQLRKLEEIQKNLSPDIENAQHRFIVPLDINDENQQSFENWMVSIQKRVENLEKEKQYTTSRTLVRVISESNNEEILVHTDSEGRIPK